MSQPFLGEVRLMGFNFAPSGYAKCDGQALQINQNQSLFSILGTTYGGNGTTFFNLPDLRGRTPIHKGNGFLLGQSGGSATETLSTAETPPHTHRMQTSTDDAQNNASPMGNVLARALVPSYHPFDSTSVLSPGLDPAVIRPAPGAGQAHENMMPHLAINFVIALTGAFPSRN